MSRSFRRGFARSCVAAACLSGVFAVSAFGSDYSITCPRSGGCVANGSSQGFVSQSVVGGGVVDTALCLGSVADPCDRAHGELLFGPHILSADAGYGATDAGVTIVPQLITLSGGGQSVQLTASNGAVGVVTVPNSGAACVQVGTLSVTASPC